MLKFKSFLTLAVAVCVSVSAAGEPLQIPLKGRILDQEQNPLPGATVYIDGTRYSAVTDIDGNYSFAKLPVGRHELSVSYIGFAPVSMTLAVDEATGEVDDITMSESPEGLEEVVVNGVFSG